MKFCSKCGKKITKETDVCRRGSCTHELKNIKNDDGIIGFGWVLFGFFIPVAGLILYFVWKNSKPLKAKSALSGTLMSAIVLLTVYIIYVVILGAYISMAL